MIKSDMMYDCTIAEVVNFRYILHNFAFCFTFKI
jgi:hypothetical protein